MELPLTKLPFLLVNSYLNLCRLPWAPPFLSSLLSFWMPTSPVETSPSICTVVIYVYIFSVERRPYINIWNVELEMPWGRDWATCSLTCCYPPTHNLSFLPLLGLHPPYQKKYSSFPSLENTLVCSHFPCELSILSTLDSVFDFSHTGDMVK